tara:strand:+ start:180 stop:911 length:732 start_codon:yes stop_codon:yes gene_type:complete
MKLQNQILHIGKFLFQYRGQIPILLILIAVPVIYKTSYYEKIPIETQSIVKCIAILIALCGLIIRFITVATTPTGTSGKNRKRQVADQLNTTGIYSIVRNPLYLANYLIWLGVSIYSLSYLLIIITSLFFFIIYEKIILVEEDFLTKKYQKKYETYSLKTPCLLPNFNNYIKSNINFDFKKIIREEYSPTLSTIISFIYIDILTYFIFEGAVHLNKLHLIIILTSVSVVLILKILKTYTSFLR